MIVECPGCQKRYDVTGRPRGTQARCRCGRVFMLPEPVRSAGAVECPQCAAPVDPSRGRCEYCSASLVAAACPRCFGRTLLGSAHCRHCGAPTDLPATVDPSGEATPRACPRCHARGVQLEGRLVDSFLLDECNECHGVYVDADTFERISQERSKAATPFSEKLQTNSVATGAMPTAGSAMYVPCPDCGTLMNRTNFARVSGVIVDMCKGHGIWFDAGELPRVVAFIRSGGLARAEQRAVEEARHETARIRTQAQRPSSLGGIPPGSSPGASPHEGGFTLGSVLRELVNILSS